MKIYNLMIHLLDKLENIHYYSHTFIISLPQTIREKTLITFAQANTQEPYLFIQSNQQEKNLTQRRCLQEEIHRRSKAYPVQSGLR